MDFFLENAAEVLLAAFMGITFLQSGIDKIIDWKGNLSWLTGHFEKTPLAKFVPFLLATVLLIEMIAGVLCTLGLVQVLASGTKVLVFYGAIASCIALLMLLFGQRVAKDYEGARTIAVYFVPAIFLVFLLQ